MVAKNFKAIDAREVEVNSKIVMTLDKPSAMAMGMPRSRNANKEQTRKTVVMNPRASVVGAPPVSIAIADRRTLLPERIGGFVGNPEAGLLAA
jgi:hypothetical protein